MQRNEDVREGEAAMATITRSEVASMLGVSVATVRRMEGKSLHPKLTDGAWRFEIDEVKNVQRVPNAVVRRTPSEGEIAAEIFLRFGEGQSLRQIVCECRQPVRVVRALYQEWTTPLGEKPDDTWKDEFTIGVREEEALAKWEADMRAMLDED
jgi:hypothetical protein